MLRKTFSYHATIALFAVFLLAGQMRVLLAGQIAGNNPVDIQTLKLVKSGSGIQLNWIEGQTPFVFLRNDQSDFDSPQALLIVDGIGPATYFDSVSLTDGLTHFYQMKDDFAPPRILQVTPVNPKLGDMVTLTGYGFGTNAADLEAAGSGGKIYTVGAPTNTAIQIGPVDAYDVTGTVMIANSKGGAFTKIIPFDLATTASANLFGALAFYQNGSTRNLFYSDRVNNKIFKLDANTGVQTQLGTLGLTRPMGMHLGTWPSLTGTQLFAMGQGDSSGATSSKGDVFAYDIGSGTRTLIASLSANGSTDPISARALSLGFDPATPANTAVFAPTFPNSLNGGLLRYIRQDGTRPAVNQYMGITINGGVTTVNSPGGLVIKKEISVPTNQGCYYSEGITTGSQRSRMNFYRNYASGSPAFDFTSDNTKHFISSAAEIALNDPNPLGYDNGGSLIPQDYSVWVADRGNSTAAPPLLSGLVKLQMDFTTSPLRARTSQFYADPKRNANGVQVMNDARGVAVEYRKDVDNLNQYPYALFVSTATAIRRVRALREVPLKIWIGDHAGSGFGAGGLPPVDRSVIESWLNNNVDFGNRNLMSVGTQVKVVPTGASGASFGALTETVDTLNFTVSLYSDATGVTCGPQLAAWANATPAMDINALNVIVVHGIVLIEGGSRFNGYYGLTKAIPTYLLSCGTKNIPIILLTYGNFNGTTNRRPSVNTLAHEIGHHIVWLAKDLLGFYDSEGHDKTFTCRHLMCGTNNENSVKWRDVDDQIVNDPRNPAHVFFYPDYGVTPP